MSSHVLESGQRVPFTRHAYWSPIVGNYVERITVFDAHGGGHWTEIERSASPMKARQTRRDALEVLARHAYSNQDPGRVDMTEEA